MPAHPEDLTGRTFGLLTVTAYAGVTTIPSGRRVHLWDVVCVCGKTKTVRAHNIRGGNTRSCGSCTRFQYAHDHTGKRYGRLTVVKRVEGVSPPRWVCVCDCGNTTEVKATNLTNGHTTSCGCLRRELRQGPKPEQWKPTTGYHNAHRRVRVLKGSAQHHACVDCGTGAHEWSYTGQDPDELSEVVNGYVLAYTLNPLHMVPRCRSCHRRYDKAQRKDRVAS